MTDLTLNPFRQWFQWLERAPYKHFLFLVVYIYRIFIIYFRSDYFNVFFFLNIEKLFLKKGEEEMRQKSNQSSKNKHGNGAII